MSRKVCRLQSALQRSRYHIAMHYDDRGWMLIRLDDVNSPSSAVVLAVDLTEQEARRQLYDLRRGEAAS